MPRDEERLARSSAERSRTRCLPGVWQAAGIAALSSLLFAVWDRSDAGSRALASISHLDAVTAAELPGALGTVDVSRDQLNRIKQEKACSVRLASVMIMRSSGEPDGRIRLQSGNYVSPAFALTATPVRIALPYPAPYAAGRGTISVVGTTEDAVVALTPPWHVLVKESRHTRPVSWIPTDGCRSSGH